MSSDESKAKAPAAIEAKAPSERGGPFRLMGWRRDVRTALSFLILMCFAFTTVVSVCCTWGAMDPKAQEKGVTTSGIMFVGGAAMIAWLTASHQIDQTF